MRTPEEKKARARELRRIRESIPEYKLKLKESRKAHYLKNKDKELAQSAKWRESNRDAHRLLNKLWKLQNPDKVLALYHKRRSLIKDVFPLKEWNDVLSRFGGWCPYCGTDGHRLTIDHFIPITRGGTNSIDNLIPCCGRCNSAKSNKLLQEWMGF